MLRVMMVVPQYPYPIVGGLERQAHELAKALTEQGIAVQALSAKVVAGQPSKEYVEGILVHRFPWPQRKWLRFLRTPFELFRVLHGRRNTYDVIHLHQHSWFGLFTIVVARILGKPILTKLPNVGKRGIPGLVAQRFGNLRLAILFCSDALVAMSRESIAELDHVGFPLERVLATPNGIRPGESMARAKLKGEMSQSCRVVFVGRLTEEKQLETLLHAWRDVVRITGNTTTLELWGTGPMKEALEKLCQELDITGTVLFRGHVDGVRDHLTSMDIFVLPSRAEGNSNALLEAMAAGLPIVSTRVGGTPMLVGPVGAELLIDVGDSEGLARHLLRLIQAPDLRKRIGAAMRQRIEEHFDIAPVARTYTEAYAFLAAGEREQVYKASNPVIQEDVVSKPEDISRCVG